MNIEKVTHPKRQHIIITMYKQNVHFVYTKPQHICIFILLYLLSFSIFGLCAQKPHFIRDVIVTFIILL